MILLRRLLLVVPWLLASRTVAQHRQSIPTVYRRYHAKSNRVGAQGKRRESNSLAAVLVPGPCARILCLRCGPSGTTSTTGVDGVSSCAARIVFFITTSECPTKTTTTTTTNSKIHFHWHCTRFRDQRLGGKNDPPSDPTEFCATSSC